MKNPSYLYELQAREKTCVFLNFTPPLQKHYRVLPQKLLAKHYLTHQA